MNSPCKDCPDRRPKCHGQCEKYQAFSAARAEALKQNRLAMDVTTHTIDNHMRIQRKIHKHTRR